MTESQSTDANRRQSEQQVKTGERKGQMAWRTERARATQVMAVEKGEIRTISQTKRPWCRSRKGYEKRVYQKTNT
jgi:hypothetical protein